MDISFFLWQLFNWTSQVAQWLRIHLPMQDMWAGDLGLVPEPGMGSLPGEGNGNPFQCSCLEDFMDRGAWQTTVHGSQRVGHDSACAHTHTHTHIMHWRLTRTGEMWTNGERPSCSQGLRPQLSGGRVVWSFIGCGLTAGWLVAGKFVTCLWGVVRKPGFVSAGQVKSITTVYTS